MADTGARLEAKEEEDAVGFEAKRFGKLADVNGLALVDEASAPGRPLARPPAFGKAESADRKASLVPAPPRPDEFDSLKEAKR